MQYHYADWTRGDRDANDPRTGEDNRAVRFALGSLTVRACQGIGQRELITKVLWLKAAIEARGGKVADFGDMAVEEVVKR